MNYINSIGRNRGYRHPTEVGPGARGDEVKVAPKTHVVRDGFVPLEDFLGRDARLREPVKMLCIFHCVNTAQPWAHHRAVGALVKVGMGLAARAL